MIRKDIVSVSTDIAFGGLYLTPDMWYFGQFIARDDLLDDVRIIHDTQPLTTSYAKFGDSISDKYHHDVMADFTMYFCDHLMAMAALTRSHNQMNVALNAIVEVAVAIFLKTIKSPDDAGFPRIIPHELENMRVRSGWKLNEDCFFRMLLAEPWLSWIELMRGQFERTRKTVSRGNTLTRMQEFREVAQKVEIYIPEHKDDREQARRAIKRAVKLHERMFGLDDVRSLLKGIPTLIEGKHFDYRLEFDRGTLFQETIIRDTGIAPTSLEIRNKKGDTLGNSCLYFEDTPILDHLLNMKLHCSNSETELDMIRGFHITRTTADFYRDPVLPDLKGIHDPVTGPLTTIDNVTSHAFSNQAHWGQRRAMHGPLFTAAKAAMTHMLRFPKGYLEALETWSRYGMWSYMHGRPMAMSLMEGKLNADLFA
jgi:hypothetical protein